MMKNIQQEMEFSGINIMHGILAGIKAECTEATIKTIEILRQSCGK